MTASRSAPGVCIAGRAVEACRVSGVPAWAGRVGRVAALIVEDDDLLFLLAECAVHALGLRPTRAGGSPAAAVFVGLDRPGLCCAPTRHEPEAAVAGALRVGYAARAVSLLGAHRAHRCCDAYLELAAGSVGPVFAHPPVGSAIERAGLTAREADVLLLLAAGATTRAVAERLCVSPATARSHCRSVLRKMGAGDRRRLREVLGETA